MSSPLREYLDTMAKLGLLARSEVLCLCEGEEDRLMTHLALMLSGGDVPGLMDAVAIVDVIVGVVAGVFATSLGLEQSPNMSHM